MAIPASGPISMSQFNTILGRSSNTANTQLAGSSTPTATSLFGLANLSGSVPPNQAAPHQMSEFYSYNANLTTRVYPAKEMVGDGSGNCVNSSPLVRLNIQFTGTIPVGSVFQAGSYYSLTGASFLNSGSDLVVSGFTDNVTTCVV